MDELIQSLKVLLANNVALKFKSHGYHWNTEGETFYQNHKLLQKIYEDFEDAIDTNAEWIRKLGNYAPYKIARFEELMTIDEPDVTSDYEIMFADLLESISDVFEDLKNIFDMAAAQREQGLCNFIADRMDMHRRWMWMLRVTLKSDPMEAPAPATPSPMGNAAVGE
jgi:starvation-inducible DNA-binding protein